MQGKGTGVYVEWNNNGFRIVVHGETGEFSNYHGIAYLKAHGVIYVAVSPYHEGCGLQPEIVYSCQEVFGPPQEV